MYAEIDHWPGGSRYVVRLYDPERGGRVGIWAFANSRKSARRKARRMLRNYEWLPERVYQ